MLDPICGPFLQKLIESTRNDQKVSEIPESTRNDQKISDIINTRIYYKVPKYQKIPTGSRYHWRLPKNTKKVPEILRKSKILNYQKVGRGVRPPLAPPKISLLSLSFTQSISLNNLGRTQSILALIWTFMGLLRPLTANKIATKMKNPKPK